MDFSFTVQQDTIRDESLQLARSLPSVDQYDLDKRSSFDFAAWDCVVKSKVFLGFIPPEHGGRGWTTLDKVIALESFGYGCSDNGLALALSSFIWTVLPPILGFGSETQAKALVANVLSGNYLYADGITEEEAGSDAMAMQTHAEARPGGYLINGGKTHIGLAPIAKELLLFAKTDPQAGSWGVSVFLVDLDSKGITRSPNREKMGLRTLPSGSISFENCFVPSNSLVGSEGSGLSIFNESMEWERGFILATQIGSMQRQLEACIKHVTSRKQFGKAIGKFQSVSNRIADMKLRLESCRLHLHRTAWLKDKNEDCALEASMTKLLISESFLSSSLDAIRLNGANGYLSEYEIERDLRDATGGVIYAGTSDIQRNLIARYSGL